MTRKLETVVTYLKMDTAPSSHIPPPSNLKIALMKLENPPVHFYRYLYETVGQEYDWVERRVLGDEALAAEINVDGVAIYVAYVGGVPAGYFELDARQNNDVWLAYFGITGDFIGTGLGKWLLHEAIATAWLDKPDSVRLETCTLDHPRALPLYQKMGFVAYERKDKVIEVED
jgi:GNAT superfamily N-acetyltransferase